MTFAAARPPLIETRVPDGQIVTDPAVLRRRYQALLLALDEAALAADEHARDHRRGGVAAIPFVDLAVAHHRAAELDPESLIDGIDHAQAARLLNHLRERGLVEARGGLTAWRITRTGQRVRPRDLDPLALEDA